MTYDGYFKYRGPVALNYDQDRAAEAHWKAELAYVAEVAALHRLGRVLDLPVGTARFWEHLRHADEVVGVDVSAEMLAIAAARMRTAGLGHAYLAQADALRLPFGDALFDTVLCFRLVHLLPAALLLPLFAELARVARNRVLLQLYSAPSVGDRPQWGIGRRIARAVRSMLPRRRAPWEHIQSFGHAREPVERALTSSGLVIVARRHLGDYGDLTIEVLELSKGPAS